MAEALTTEPVPLVFGEDGVMRVRGTRVTLETVLSAFAEGATAEEIAQRYPSISLAGAYQVIGYCPRHASELEPYLERRRRQDIRETRRSNESIWLPVGIRDSRKLSRDDAAAERLRSRGVNRREHSSQVGFKLSLSNFFSGD